MIKVLIIIVGVAFFGVWLRESRRRVRHPVAPGLDVGTTIPYEQEFELYHNALSLCSMKTRVCLSELNLAYRSHHIDLIETGCYENIRTQYLKINPAGTLPVLVHNGHPVYESHVQIVYAAEHAPASAPNLVPDSDELVQQMQYWIDEAAIKGDPLEHGPNTAGNAIPGLTAPLFSSMVKEIPLWKIAEGLLFHFDKRRPIAFFVLKLFGLGNLHRLKPAMKLHSDSRVQMHNRFDALERQIQSSEGPWILGEQFTLADVSWLVIFERLEQVDSLHVFMGDSLRPELKKYWQALKARPSYRSAIAEHNHSTVARGTARLVAQKGSNVMLQEALDGARH